MQNKDDDNRSTLIAVAVFVFFMAACLLGSVVFGDEREEVRRLALKYNARVEVRQWDDTRIDMVTETHAIECDWSKSWAQAIGQSLYYSAVSGLKPGIILLVKSQAKEQRHIFRCQTVCVKHGITLWIELVEDSP